jgi:hypothetical protein
MPHGMNRVHRLVVGLVGVILLLWVGLSWGPGPPPNIDISLDGNTAGGTGALVSNIVGTFNTAFGARALLSNLKGSRSTATGFDTLFSNTNGDNNTASGASALRGNTIGHFNTASGVSALLSNTDGAWNTASGSFALATSTAGDLNTAFGARVLESKTTGSNNTAIGAEAGSKLSTGNHNIYLGSPGVPTESNTMRLGADGTHTRTFIAGVANVLVNNSDTVLIDKTTGQLGTIPSSARYKQDIQPMGTRSQRLHQLQPVTFRYIQDEQGE